MKIVVLSQALHPAYGGSAVSEASLCASLQKRCHTVVLCRAGRVDDRFVRGFGLTDVKEFHPAEVLNAWRDSSHWLTQLLGSADVIHLNGHWKWENILAARLGNRLGVPYTLQPRGMLWLGSRKLRLKRLFNTLLGNRAVADAAKLIALSRFEAAQWEPYGIGKDRYEVIPNGIFCEAQAKMFSSPFPDPYFFYLGRLESRKNLLFLVTAFQRYVRDGGKAKLRLMGPAQRGYDTRIQKHAQALGVGERVEILAPVYGGANAAYLQNAIGVIYPGVGEPFGRVPFETLAAGGVPIVPRESGSAEYLEPHLPESIYQIDDSDALVAAMRRVEMADPSLLAAAKRRAREWVRTNLDWDLITARMLHFYTEVAVVPVCPSYRFSSGTPEMAADIQAP